MHRQVMSTKEQATIVVNENDQDISSTLNKNGNKSATTIMSANSDKNPN